MHSYLDIDVIKKQINYGLHLVKNGINNNSLPITIFIKIQFYTL